MPRTKKNAIKTPKEHTALSSVAIPIVLSKHIKLSNGYNALYSGEVDAQGRPHGYGEHIITSNGQFEGQVSMGMFVHGELQGVGKVVGSRGQKSTGVFVKGFLEGFGLVEYGSESSYAGQWKGSKMHGIGKLIYDGVIIGWFADNKHHGTALWLKADGSKVALKWKHNEVVSRSKGLIINDVVICLLILLEPKHVLQREKDMNCMFSHLLLLRWRILILKMTNVVVDLQSCIHSLVPQLHINGNCWAF
jgi:hypothetical protein